jgi:hypothetical protein
MNTAATGAVDVRFLVVNGTAVRQLRVGSDDRATQLSTPAHLSIPVLGVVVSL